MKQHLTKTGILSIFFVLVLFSSVCLAEGATILHKQQKADGVMGQPGQESTSVTYLSSDSIFEKSSTGIDMLISLDKGSILNVNHKEKEYSEYTMEELNQALATLGSGGTAEEQQGMAMMKQMMGNMAQDAKLEKLGPAESIAGHSTVKYQLTISPMVITIWAAPDIKMPAAYFDTMKVTATKNPMFDLSAMFDALKQIEGVALRTDTVFSMMGMKVSSREEVIRIESGSFPDVAVPAGYKKVSIF